MLSNEASNRLLYAVIDGEMEYKEAVMLAKLISKSSDIGLSNMKPSRIKRIKALKTTGDKLYKFAKEREKSIANGGADKSWPSYVDKPHEPYLDDVVSTKLHEKWFVNKKQWQRRGNGNSKNW